ncbi:uncharacterized protein LOC126673733 [Mercurialis annua]|uniref:uncharacterized protein LOC126673733 n=1 Tax=Mercurialis annua TaxID=3986 RepID=UPI002160A2E1|nr:uncharacterized protein LOC126673733 [Mercurialis annua]
MTTFFGLVWCSILLAFGMNGCLADEKIGIYELKNGNISIKLTNYGAHLISVYLPDRNGKVDDVILGYDTVQEYMNDKSYFGATVGRVANRIGGAQFTLNGTTYKLAPNEGKNMLHGGPKGLSKVIWKAKKIKADGHPPHMTFTYRSINGDQGFPGNLRVTVSYALLENNQLSITMKAKAENISTPVNLANHAYWNLAGQSSGDILSHQLQLFASRYTPVDASLIPTGKITSVKGTPYDFLTTATIGSRINQLPGGYDINYALDASLYNKMRKAAVVHDKKSGRVMELYTNQVGVQFYTSNTLEQKGKGGFVYKPHAALCLETQGYPNAVNQPNFPSVIVNPGKSYKHYMLIKFSIA